MNKYKYILPILLFSLFINAEAESVQNVTSEGQNQVKIEISREITGRVVDIGDSNITIVKNGITLEADLATTSTYVVDVSHAKFIKKNQDVVISDLKLQDLVVVNGYISSSTIDAETVRVILNTNDAKAKKLYGKSLIIGRVTSLDGTDIYISTDRGDDFAVDASNAVIRRAGVKNPTVSDINVDNKILIQGNSNGKLINADYILDNTPIKNIESNKANFFSSLGGALKKFFGF